MHDGFVEFEADSNANYQRGGTASFSAGGFSLEQDDGCSGIGKATAERFRRKGYRIIGGRCCTNRHLGWRSADPWGIYATGLVMGIASVV